MPRICNFPPLVGFPLCVAIALWVLWMFTLHPGWREQTRVMGLFFAGLVVLTGILVVRDPWFGLFTPFGYFYAFGILPWPGRLLGVAVVALESGSAQAYGVAKDNVIGLTVLDHGLSLALAASWSAYGRRYASDRLKFREAEAVLLSAFREHQRNGDSA